jgi:Rrf2 family protein
MPERFLLHILNSLVKNGIAASRLGAKGGYWLTRPLSKISLLDVTEAVENADPLFPDIAATQVLSAKQKTLFAKLESQVNGDARTRFARVKLSELQLAKQ